ncbi:hypothetical protein ACUN0C_14410 [Faunimonas sp. B44]|uniref:hypothetical protein n=1 Tax=Faunimonas sp. B44 TaxID=3461493 RepID=UPI004044F383
MTAPATITGWACRLGRPFGDRLDMAVRETVLAALSVSNLPIDAIDSVVTVASDTLDGLSVPGRGEIAGNYGRSYLNLPSSAGHGLGAAVVQIESGSAENLLLVGWGAATKLAREDSRRNQADPFYARPIGASPRALAALQANELSGLEGSDPRRLQAYADRMRSRAWADATETPAGATPVWARSGFCDGAVAIVLQRGSGSRTGIGVTGIASVSRPYSPEDERLDPAEWVSEALGCLPDTDDVDGGSAGIVEAAAPTPAAEARALGALSTGSAQDIAGFNASGGGAVAYFGAATGLRQVAEASRALAAKGTSRPSSALVLDLAGPLGQHVTAIYLRAGGAA